MALLRNNWNDGDAFTHLDQNDVANEVNAKIDKAVVAAKGDLIAGTNSATVGRVPAGASGQVLVASPGQTTGVAWSSTLPQTAVVSLTQDLAARELTANKGQAGGYAPLNSSTKIDSVFLPDSTSPADELPNESGFWWSSEPVAVNGRVYMGTCASDRGSWLQEWSQPVAGGPMWLQRYFMGFTDQASSVNVPESSKRDDHNPAQPAVKAGKPMVVFWTGHGSNNRLLYRISDQNVDAVKPGELTFGPIQTHEIPGDERTSYTLVMINGDDIWVMHRGGWSATNWWLTRFPAWGTGTPVSTKILFSSPSGGLPGQTYVKARMVNGVIRCMSSDHPTNSEDNKIWYFEIDVTTGTITKADGTVLGNLSGTNLPLPQSALDVVFTGSGSSRPWGFDVGYGTLRELAFFDAVPTSVSSTGRYRHARYENGAWVVSEITAMGSVFNGAYFPHITFVPDAANTVMLMRSTGTTSGTSSIERWARSGSTWTASQVVDSSPYDLTTGVPRKALTRTYPVRVEAGSAPFTVIGTDIREYPTYDHSWVMNVRPLPLSLPVRRVPPDSPIQVGLAKEPKSPTVGLYLPGTAGTYIEGPTASSTIPAAGVRLEVDFAVPDFTPTQFGSVLLAKQGTGSTSSLFLSLMQDGKLSLYWSENGSTNNFLFTNKKFDWVKPWTRIQVAVAFHPSVAEPFIVNQQTKCLWIWYRFGDEEPWILFDAIQGGASTSIFAGGSRWEIGSRQLGTEWLANAVFYRASVMTVGGRVLTEWRADKLSTNGSQLDSAGYTWTVKSPTGIGTGTGGGAGLVSGGALGTPSSGTLTNCTGLPQSGVVDLSTNLQTSRISDPATGHITALFQTTGTTASGDINYLQIRSSHTNPNIQAGSTFDQADVPIVLVPRGSGVIRIQSPSSTPTLEAGGGTGNENLDLRSRGSGIVTANGQPILFSGGALGTPSSGSLANCTGLPQSGVTGLTADLAGKASVADLAARVTTGGALGTPSSGILTNCTGLRQSGVVHSVTGQPISENLSVTHLTDPATGYITALFQTTASPVNPDHNYLLIRSSNTNPNIQAASTFNQADIPIVLVPKGSGVIRIQSPNNTPTLEAGGATGNENLDLRSRGSGIVTANGQPILFSGGALGTPSSGTLTNCTGLPQAGVTNLTTDLAAKVTTGGALGTPSSGTLTNCTGLPQSGVTSLTTDLAARSVNEITATHTAQQIELGHATDTTLTRKSAGILAVEGADVSTDVDHPHELTSGEATMPRRMAQTLANNPGSGNLRLTYFTARKNETIGKVRAVVNTVASGLTLARVGVYSVASNGNLTLVASTPNDTAIFNVAGLTEKALSASFAKVRGQRYAVGVLVVGTTSPNLVGAVCTIGAECGLEPRISGFLSGQTDLPETITATNVADTSQNLYVSLVP